MQNHVLLNSGLTCRQSTSVKGVSDTPTRSDYTSTYSERALILSTLLLYLVLEII